MKKTLFSLLFGVFCFGLFGQASADMEMNDFASANISKNTQNTESSSNLKQDEIDDYIILSEDRTSKTIVKDYKIKSQTSKAVLENFNKMNSPVQVYDDGINNRLILTGKQNEVKTAIQLLEFLDEEETMVEVEFLLVEYIHGNDLDWSLDITQGQFGSFNGINFSTGGNAFVDFAYNGVNRLSPKFDLNLSALAGENKAKIHTNPHVTTRSGTQARFDLKENFKVELQSVNAISGAINQRLQDIEAGITLTVTPTATANGIVRMDVLGTISQFLTIDLTSEDAAFRTETSEIKTNVDVKDGETLIIGGVIKEVDNNIDAGLPWLRKIPILGYLFKRKRIEKQYTERVMYITPRIVRGSEINANESIERYRSIRQKREIEIEVENEIETDPGLLKYKRVKGGFSRRKERRNRKRAEREVRRLEQLQGN